MAIKFKDFILDWYKAYHLDNMDDARRQRWADLRGKEFEVNSRGDRVYLDDKRNGAQKGWANPNTGELATQLPVPDLSDEDWEYFYRLCRSAIRNINDKRDDLLRKDPDRNPLPIDKWFGEKNLKPFSVQEVGSQIKERLKLLAAVIATSPRLKNKLMDNFTNEYSIDTFLADLTDMNYSRNSQYTIPKIQTIIRVLPGLLRPEYDFKNNEYKNTLDDETVGKIQSIFIGRSYDSDKGIEIEEIESVFDNMSAQLDPVNEAIDPMQLAQFKHPSVYKEILKSLYASDKAEKKSAFHNTFANNGGGEITGYMNEVVSGNNYESGANELVPKLAKELNTTETIKDKIDDFTDEHLRRLTDRSARHIYVEPSAKGVVDAILKEKISPTDGIDKILEKKNDITKRVVAKSPISKKGCDFLFEALEYIKSSGDMGKALSGALKNGRKAEAIAFEIIKYAISKRKFNDAKVALEVLAVMRYDTFSSKHWSAFKQAQGGILGDKNLSWNKNESVATVMRLFDSVFWTGVNGLFWAGVTARNTIQHMRGKMSPNDMGRMEKALEKIQRDSDDFQDLATARAEHTNIRARLTASQDEFGYAMILRDEQRELDTEIAHLESEIPAARSDANLEAKIAQLRTRRAGMNMRISRHTANFARYDDLLSAKQKLDTDISNVVEAMRTETDVTTLEQLRTQLEAKRRTLELRLGSLRVYEQMREDYKSLEVQDRVAQELYERLNSGAERGVARETESKPYSAPMSDIQNMQMLMAFWNAANGYTHGINVNSYNIFRNIKNVRSDANLANIFNMKFARQNE